MIFLPRPPALIHEASRSRQQDPLVALLDAAYQQLDGLAPPDQTGLLVAGDGSWAGAREVFRLAGLVRAPISPRLIPMRLSNGPASALAIGHGHTGRVLTFSDGESSLFRALVFLIEAAGVPQGPRDWLLLAGDVDEASSESVRGYAVAFRVTLNRTQAAAPTLLLSGVDAPPIPALTCHNCRDLALAIARASQGRNETLFCFPGETALPRLRFCPSSV